MSPFGSINTLFFRLRSFWQKTWYRACGVQVGNRVVVHGSVEIAVRRPPSGKGLVIIGDDCELSSGVVLHSYGGKIQLADDVFLGPHTVIYGHGGVEVGEHTLVAMHCCILSSEHTVPAQGAVIRQQPDLLKPTRIGRDVWLGAGVIVLGGVTIGDGCVIGAGSVVTKSLPPGTVAIGVPAKAHRQRNNA
jgi:acetyltransferase-like isoleucine patch superfamily enzyme